MSHLSIILLSPEKSPHLNQEKNLHRPSIYKPKQSKTALNKYVGGFWCERQQDMDVFTGWSIIIDYGLFWPEVLIKNILMMDLFQLLSSQDVNWWTGMVWITCGLLWCFYQLFGLSFWRHPFTAEHPLLSRWWNVIFLQIWWKNKLVYILNDLSWGHFSAFSIFGWTIP